MGIKELLDLVNTHGLALLITIIVVFFAFKFGNLGFEHVKGKLTGEKHEGLLDLRAQVSPAINTILDRTMLRLAADRAYVCEYHNTGGGFGGLPFAKMSCTYEALNSGVGSQMDARRDMFLSSYSTHINDLTARDYVVLDVNNRTDADTNLGYETLASRGVIKTLRAKITDTNKRPIGYIGADYSVDDARFRESEFARIIMETALEIGALLSVNKERK
ncbi:MAG: hypothetical protein FWG40_00615 [Peptococcaceae bacterium]|nr:hypothetical protein [Peptococcaceae bacterium]